MRAITRTMASLSSQCDPGNAKDATCPRSTTKGTDNAARTASAALAAVGLATELTQDAIPAAATSAMNPQEKVTASIRGYGWTPPRAISTTPCASHKAPPTSAAQAATLRRLVTETSVSHQALRRGSGACVTSPLSGRTPRSVIKWPVKDSLERGPVPAEGLMSTCHGP